MIGLKGFDLDLKVGFFVLYSSYEFVIFWIYLYYCKYLLNKVQIIFQVCILYFYIKVYIKIYKKV